MVLNWSLLSSKVGSISAEQRTSNPSAGEPARHAAARLVEDLQGTVSPSHRVDGYALPRPPKNADPSVIAPQHSKLLSGTFSDCFPTRTPPIRHWPLALRAWVWVRNSYAYPLVVRPIGHRGQMTTGMTTRRFISFLPAPHLALWLTGARIAVVILMRPPSAGATEPNRAHPRAPVAMTRLRVSRSMAPAS